MKIAAVIVTFNRLEKLKITLEKSLTEDLDLILVVNNASTDGTQLWLDSFKNADSRIEVIHMPKNLGGAGGFERGFAEVIAKNQFDWLVCYDDDAYPQPQTINQFRKLNLTQDIGAVSAAVFDLQGQVAEMNRPSLNPFLNLSLFFKTLLKGRDGFHLKDQEFFNNTERFIDVSSFVGLFVRTDLIKKDLGLPRGELFIYADDVLYTLKLRQLGYKNLFLSRLKFTHDCGSVAADSKHFRHPFQPMWKVYYTFRNNIEVFRVISGPLFIPIFCLKFLSWIGCVRFYSNKKVYLKMLFMAVSDGLRRRYPYVQDQLVQMNQVQTLLPKPNLPPAAEKPASRPTPSERRPDLTL